jgi:hypothetical protein
VRLFAGDLSEGSWLPAADAMDACGTFTHDKREAGIARLTVLGIEVSDYATLIVEILADNTDPKANEVYAALDMPFATLMGQVAAGYRK